MPNTPTSTDTIIAAASGYSLFAFAPGELKPSMNAFQDLLRTSALQPVIAWRCEGAKLTPLAPLLPPDAAQRYLLLPNGRVLGLDDGTAFPNQDLWASTLVAEWTKRRPQPQTVSIIPGRRPEPVVYA